MTHQPGIAIRTAATSIIWGFATGMLAICIPLVAATNSGPILPLAVITAATAGTFAVWRFDSQTRNNFVLINDANRLEQRVTNLETISSNQELESENKFKQLESRD